MVEAAPQDCFDALLDFGSYPDWQSAVKACEVQSRDDDGRGRRVAFDIDAKVKTVSYTLDYSYEEPAPAELALRGGRREGRRRRVHPRGPGRRHHARHLLACASTPGVWLPGPMASMLTDTGDAAVGGGPQGARRGARPDPHRPHPPQLRRPLRVGSPAAGDRARARPASAGGRCACCPSAASSLTERLEEAGAEVVTHPLAVLRRGLLPSPRGGARAGAPRCADRRELGALAREHDAALVHSTPRSCCRGQCARAWPAHLIHVREIYPRTRRGLLWPLMRRRLLRADALACISERRRDAVRGLAEGAPAGPRRPAQRPAAAGRDAGARAAGAGARRVRGRAHRPPQRLEGPGRARRGPRRPALAGRRVGVVAGDEVPGHRVHAAALDRAGGRAGHRGTADAARVRRRRGRACSARQTPWWCPPSARSRSARWRSRPPPRACRWWPPRPAAWRSSCARPGRGCSCRPATRPRWPPRCAAIAEGAGGGRRPLAERFSSERMVSELQALYDELAG